MTMPQTALRALLAVSLLLAATPGVSAPLEAPLPPLQPWSGASTALIARPGDPWITPAEAAGFVDSPDYATTLAWLKRLVAASPLLTLETFGTSPQGRAMVLVRAHSGKTAKPVVLVQAGIHAGEIDGKDAGLMLLRDIALRGKSGLLDKADLVFVPIFNVDGHERASAFNRPNQRGPRLQGWRTTGQNLNLNRDYLKADTPEMQAMIGLIRRLDPVLYLDLHVTDGSNHQYDITYAFPGWNGYYAQSPAIGRWLDSRFRAAEDASLSAHGHIPGYYVSLFDDDDPDKGITNFADAARYSNGYADLRRIPAVLLETHSLKPYRQRVLGTYVFIEAALQLIKDDLPGVTAAIAQDRAARPARVTQTWKTLDTPLYTIDFRGIAHSTTRATISGRPEVRWLGTPVTLKMPVYGQAADVTTAMPVAWWVPPTELQTIAHLKLHGIAYETITTARTIALDMVRLSEPKLQRVDEGHVPLKASYQHITRTQLMPAGAVRVPSDQPLGLLAAAMLDAESPESLLAWGYFPHILQRTEYIEGYALVPLAEAMLAADPALKIEFEAKLKAEPAFAADPKARLEWFYARSAYYDDQYLLYPVARERATK